MTRREISLMNTDTHKIEEKLRAVESKKVETGVKAVKTMMLKLMKTDGIFGPLIVLS